jgi:NhaA family Na+:H+ antiporter
LRGFLLTLAIADDVAAIALIAVFYAEGIDLYWLGGAFVLCLAIVLVRKVGVRNIGPYLVLGTLVWLATLHSGVHATLAGVALGLIIPARGDPAPLETLQRKLHPWSSFAVIPLFALANAGVRIDLDQLGDAIASPITRGIVIGLVVGKTVGIAGFAWMAVRLGVGALTSEDVIYWGERPSGGSVSRSHCSSPILLSMVASNQRRRSASFWAPRSLHLSAQRPCVRRHR